MSEVIITKENFKSEVITSEKKVLLDFWAEWCGPCRMLSPVLKEIAEENESIKVCKINVDEEPEIANGFNVDSIPALFVIENGEVVNASVGYMDKEKVLELLK